MTVSTTNTHLLVGITSAGIIRRVELCKQCYAYVPVGMYQGTNLKVPFALKEVKQVRDEGCKSSVFSCSHDA